MSTLNFLKVNNIPSTLSPSTMYLLKNDNDNILQLFATDKNATVVYRTFNKSDIDNLILNLLSSVKNIPNGIAGLDSNGNITGTVISTIDGQNTPLTSNGNNVWRNLDGKILLKATTGGTNPTFGTTYDDKQGIIMSGSSLQQFWVNFILDTDIAVGSTVYPIIYWMPLTTSTGVVRWGISYNISEGHNTDSISSTVTIYNNHNLSSNRQYYSQATILPTITSSVINPDSVILLRVFRDAGNSQDTHNSNINLIDVKLKVQTARIGTRNIQPDFFI